MQEVLSRVLRLLRKVACNPAACKGPEDPQILQDPPPLARPGEGGDGCEARRVSDDLRHPAPLRSNASPYGRHRTRKFPLALQYAMFFCQVFGNFGYFTDSILPNAYDVSMPSLVFRGDTMGDRLSNCQTQRRQHQLVYLRLTLFSSIFFLDLKSFLFDNLV
jgi:hypothetical protein